MRYVAGTREQPRRITVKAEHAARDSNPQYPVTNLTAKPTYLYQRLYCARGDMENRIKEQQLSRKYPVKFFDLTKKSNKYRNNSIFM